MTTQYFDDKGNECDWRKSVKKVVTDEKGDRSVFIRGGVNNREWIRK